MNITTSHPSQPPVFECCCCFTDADLNNLLTCPIGHITCSDCLERALQVAVGDRTVIQCFHESGCTEHFSEIAIRRATEDLRLRKAYNNVVAVKNFTDAGVEDIYSCPFCDNVVSLDADIEKFQFFHCHSCDKTSCRQCSDEKHDGPCNKQRRQEEELTDKFILTCRCNARIFRGDGCNHLQCTLCRKHWCWLCKQQLFGSKANMYRHFQGQGGDGVCELYKERPEDQVFAEPAQTTQITRHRIDTDSIIVTQTPQIVGYGIGCATAPTAAGGPQRRQRAPRAVLGTCIGHYKKTGENCRLKAKRNGNGLCGYHRRQAIIIID